MKKPEWFWLHDKKKGVTEMAEFMTVAIYSRPTKLVDLPTNAADIEVKGRGSTDANSYVSACPDGLVASVSDAVFGQTDNI